jgi:hypothetical protein
MTREPRQRRQLESDLLRFSSVLPLRMGIGDRAPEALHPVRYASCTTLRGSQCTGGERRGEKKVTYKQVPDLTNVTRSGGIHMLRSSRGAEREQAKRRVESRLWIKYPGT